MLTWRLLLPTPALLIRPARAATLPFGALRGATTAVGVHLTPQAMALVGSRVTIPGFVAPTLKPEPDFLFARVRPRRRARFAAAAPIGRSKW